MKKAILIIFMLMFLGRVSAWAQLTYGVTGLLHAPSAEMQKNGTFMFGANFLNQELTPPRFNYHTANYYANIT